MQKVKKIIICDKKHKIINIFPLLWDIKNCFEYIYADKICIH